MTEYGRILAQYEPRVITSKKEYRRAIDASNELRGMQADSDAATWVKALFDSLIYVYEGEQLARRPVGELLRDELAARGMSQAELARVTDVDPTTISNVINGRRGFSKADAKVISRTLHMRYEAFMPPIDGD